MSRKLRQEQQYALQLKQEAEEEEDKIKLQQARIFGPITWFKLKSGFRVQDLREKHYETVLNIIKSEYFDSEVLLKNSCITEDEVSLRSLLNHIIYTMKDSTSIILIDEQKDCIAGVQLLRVSTKQDLGRVFSRTIHTNGEARQKCLAINTALNRKIDIFNMYNCDSFLRYYLMCIKREYRHQDLGYHLMRAGLDVARSLNIKVVSGIFTDVRRQKLAKRLNFELLQEVSYTNWRLNYDLIFSDPGAGNYTCAIMAAVVPKERMFDPNEVYIDNPAGLIMPTPPRTRLEKRRALNRQRSSFIDNACRRD